MRMARWRTSGENLFVVLLISAPLSQKLEPPANPVRFIVSLSTHCVAVSDGLFCDVFSRGVVIDIEDAEGLDEEVRRVLVLTKRIAPATIASKTPVPTTGATAKVDQLFRKAIKAETNAVRIKLTPHEVFMIHPSKEGWYWLGTRENVEDQILTPRPNNRLAGNSPAAAAYRAAMGC
jgi:hypothetical protein